MVNQFDKYFGSEYIPQYTPLPLDDIGRGLYTRQRQHEENLVNMDQLEDVFRKVQYLPQDKQLVDNELQQLRSQFDQFATEGDYSQAKPFIRRIANKFQESMTNGTLGSAQRSYQNYLKDIEQIDKSNRPTIEKELAKQMRFNQYKGIDPNRGEPLFNQTYRESPVPDYINVLEEGMKYAKELKPQEISQSHPWFQTSDGMRWLQNSRKTEELPREVIQAVTKYALLQNPKVQESLAFTALTRGEDPNQFIEGTINNTSLALGEMYKRNNVTTDQSMQQTSEWQYNMGNKAQEEQLPYEAGQYEGNNYFKNFDNIFSMNDEGVTQIESKTSPSKDAVPMYSSGLGEDMTTVWGVPNKSGKINIPDEYKEVYNNVAKIVPGKDDRETYENVKKYINNLKEKGLSSSHIPMSNKDLNTASEFLQKQFLSRKFVDPETGEVYHGADIVKDKNGILKSSLKDVKGKEVKDIVDNLTVVGRVSNDNPYADLTGDKDFSSPYRVRLGSKYLIASPAAGETTSNQGTYNEILNTATRASRTTLPVDIGKELGNKYPELRDMTIDYDSETGTYRVENKGYSRYTTLENLFNTIALVSDGRKK